MVISANRQTNEAKRQTNEAKRQTNEAKRPLTHKQTEHDRTI